MFNPGFLSFFTWGTGILLAIVFIWDSFELNALPPALIFLFGIVGLIFWGISGLIGGLIIGWIATMLIGLLTIPIGKIFDIGRIKKEYRIAIAKDFFLENKEKILALEKEGFGNALVAGGGTLNASFMAENLVDEIYLDVEPVAIGKGIRLFREDEFEAKLKLLETKKLSENEIQLRYQILK